MSKYRINVRFDTDDPKQAEAVKFLQSLEHSRNTFIVSTVLEAISGKSAHNNITLENIRQVILLKIALHLKKSGESYGRNCRRCRWLRHLLFFSRQRQNSPKKSKPKMKRVFLMILKCSVEPKAGFMAQYSNFREKTEPVWLKGRYAPKGKGAVFGIV